MTGKVKFEASDRRGFLGTTEFFPEEGKYHFDGHRACGIVWDPPTTLAHNGLCTVCGKPVTVGVMHRVELLADRPQGGRPTHTLPFHSLIPLPEMLGQVYDVGAGSRRVDAEYMKLLGRLGPELVILRDVPVEEIAAVGGERLAEAIDRMRRSEVIAQPGYDGEYGVIRVFGAATAQVSTAQIGLFGDELVERRAESVERRAESETAFHEPRPSYETVDEQAEIAPVEVAPRSNLSTPLPPEVAPRSTLHPLLLDGLNPEQRAAVLCTDRPLIIVAGPGTGKTRTLTVRIAHLILEQGVAPENVLAITFTNKSAGEMRERLSALLDLPKPLGSAETLEASPAGRVTIKTFHAFGAMLLREHAARLGLSPEFVILTEEDRATLLRQACPDIKQREVDAFLTRISEAKSRLLGVDSPKLAEVIGTRTNAEDADKSKGKQPHSSVLVSEAVGQARVPFASDQFPQIYRRYEAALRESDAVDFDDLILLPIRLLAEHPDVLAAVQNRFRWISVDEYQDVNLAQYRLLRLLTGGGANLCVIGDPDQAIYGFRGADHRYFLQFEQDFPGAVALSLSRNYRSSQRILDAASQVIARNPDRKSVGILAEFADEVRLDVYRAPTDKAEAEYVVHQIEQMVGGTSYFSLDSGRTDGAIPAAVRSFADFAVLYRLSALSRPLAEAFDRSGIPYQTVGQAPLSSHKAVREVQAYLWLLHNPRSRVHLETVLAAGNPVFGTQAMERVWAGRNEASLPLSGRTAGLSEDTSLLPFAAAASTGFSAAQRSRLLALATFYRALAQGKSERSVARLVERVGQFAAESRGGPWSDTDAQHLHKLALRAVPFEDRLADFLEAIALQSETDAYDPRADRVTLMTLHAAKGLEFPIVFIVGCEEGLLPYERKGEVVDVAEERRLFYVGLTRAQNKLILTHARKRVLFGQFMANAPSRFVGDIEAALKEIQEMKYRPPERKSESSQLSLF